MANALLLVALLLVVPLTYASISSREGPVKYDGYRVVRALISTPQQKSRIESLDLDVWSNDGAVGYGLIDLMANDTELHALDTWNVPYKVIIKDVEENIQAERHHLETTRARAPAAWFDSYHTYDEINTFITQLAAAFPALVTVTNSIGSSVQGRSLRALRITAGSAANKRKIYIEGGQHAREWIAPHTVLYIAEKLVTGYNSDSAVTTLLNTGIIYIVPLVNPDGYVYTWSTNRLWRKNRRANTGGTYGVDLNRNWNDHWGGQGSSGNPGDDTYRGTAPFSEPESVAASNWINSNGPFNGAIDYHSYSQLVLRPYGWSNSLPPNDATAKRIGDAYSAAVKTNSGKAYTSQASWQLYYTTGSAQDWFYGQAKVPLSYTVELRDTGTYGFQLPANQIIPTGEENWAGFKSFAASVTLD